MTSRILPVGAVTTALVVMLRAQLGDIRVYLSGDVYDTEMTYPYLKVARTRAADEDTPPLAGPGLDCVTYQFDAVGRRQDQAEGLMDRVSVLLLDSDGAGGWAHDVAVAGWRCIWRAVAVDAGTSPEGQPKLKLFVPKRRVEFRWAPSS